jgi:hypothetical protein
MRQHPIHFGFMASVGGGLALLAYFMIMNVGQLLLWIGRCPVHRPGLDRRALARRAGHAAPAGITLSLRPWSGLVVGSRHAHPTIVDQTSQIVDRGPAYAETS